MKEKELKKYEKWAYLIGLLIGNAPIMAEITKAIEEIKKDANHEEAEEKA